MIEPIIIPIEIHLSLIIDTKNGQKTYAVIGTPAKPTEPIYSEFNQPFKKDPVLPNDDFYSKSEAEVATDLLKELTEKPFMCKDCDYKAATQKGLNIHRGRFHKRFFGGIDKVLNRPIEDMTDAGDIDVPTIDDDYFENRSNIRPFSRGEAPKPEVALNIIDCHYKQCSFHPRFVKGTGKMYGDHEFCSMLCVDKWMEGEPR